MIVTVTAAVDEMGVMLGSGRGEAVMGADVLAMDVDIALMLVVVVVLVDVADAVTVEEVLVVAGAAVVGKGMQMPLVQSPRLLSTTTVQGELSGRWGPR